MRKGDECFKLYHKFEIARFKVYRHCGVLNPNLIPMPPSTRSKENIYTVRIESDCQQGCNNRHVELPHRAYLAWYTSLPFECSHRTAVTAMFVEEPEDRTAPVLTLPPQIRKH